MGSARMFAGGHVGQLLAHDGAVPAIGDDVDVARLDQRREAGDGGLEQRGVADERQEGLGLSARLSGQRRVPPPPAMITAYIRVS